MSSETFFDAYVTCALWSSMDNADESGGEPLDRNYGPDDIAPETLERMRTDCDDFEQSQAQPLLVAYETPGYTEASAGHDFWLTRNGHGAGFWERGLGEVGDALTEAAHAYGSVDLTVGDDGKIYA